MPLKYASGIYQRRGQGVGRRVTRHSEHSCPAKKCPIDVLKQQDGWRAAPLYIATREEPENRALTAGLRIPTLRLDRTSHKKCRTRFGQRPSMMEVVNLKPNSVGTNFFAFLPICKTHRSAAHFCTAQSKSNAIEKVFDLEWLSERLR